jgi:transcriptional regulator with XRE-family HTH domain
MRKDRLQSVRVKRGYTQESLAEELGIEKKQISRWETGNTIPGSDKLGQIARILNVSTDYLLGLSDDPTPHMRVDNLTEDERAVLNAMRSGDDKEAIKIIANR